MKWFQHNGKVYQVKSKRVDHGEGYVEYAVTIHNTAGTLLHRACEPASVETQIEWFKADLDRQTQTKGS
jgi:hypothetical protein